MVRINTDFWPMWRTFWPLTSPVSGSRITLWKGKTYGLSLMAPTRLILRAASWSWMICMGFMGVPSMKLENTGSDLCDMSWERARKINGSVASIVDWLVGWHQYLSVHCSHAPLLTKIVLDKVRKRCGKLRFYQSIVTINHWVGHRVKKEREILGQECYFELLPILW